MGLFDEIKSQPQTPEQLAELEKWHEGVKKKAAAALEAREERFRQAEKDFEELVKGKQQDDEVVGDVRALTIDKNTQDTETEKTIEVIPDHFSPEAVRQDFLPRSTIPPPPMRELVNQIHPERKSDSHVHVSTPDPGLAAVATAIGELSKRIDVLGTNQELVANKTLNAVCNSLNELVVLFRKEMNGLQDRLAAEAVSKLESQVKPVLESLTQLKKELEPEPKPEPEPQAKEPAPQVQVEEKQTTKTLGELCFNLYRSMITVTEPMTPSEYTAMELSYEFLLKKCDYDSTKTTNRFLKAAKDYCGHSNEFDLSALPSAFYKWLKETT